MNLTTIENIKQHKWLSAPSFLSFVVLVVANHVALAQTGTWNNTDVGAVTAAGSSSQSNGTYTVSGDGADIWGTADAFQFYYQSMTGDGTITARVVSQTDTSVWAKAGVMIRETLSAGSTQALAAVTPSSGVVFQHRTMTGGESTNTFGPMAAAPYWVRMVRTGNTFTAYSSSDGTKWTEIGADTISMASTVYVGLAVTSHSAGVLSTATFDSVTTPTAAVCSPLTYGAIGDGVTDNTSAIQTAINACAAQGGGIVELSVTSNQGVYLTGPVTLKSNVQLQIDIGVTLQGTNDHSRYVGAYIKWGLSTE